jgi:hypothetical protein
LISGSAGGVAINGAGTVTNSGLISSSYGFGVELLARGVVMNSGAASGISGSTYGVSVAGSAGTVTNEATITNTPPWFGSGVDLTSGGKVTDSRASSSVPAHTAAGAWCGGSLS